MRNIIFKLPLVLQVLSVGSCFFIAYIFLIIFPIFKVGEKATNKIANASNGIIDKLDDIIKNSFLVKRIFKRNSEEEDGWSAINIICLTIALFIIGLVGTYALNTSKGKATKSCHCAATACKNCVCRKGGQTCNLSCTYCSGKTCNNASIPPAPISNQDLVNTKDPMIYTYIGIMNAGKSTAIKSLLHHYSQANFFHFGLIIAGTAFTGQYQYLRSRRDNNIWTNYNEEHFKKYIEGLRNMVAGGIDLPPNFVLFDDLLGLIPHYSKWFKNWISTFRKTNTYVFITAQQISQGTSTLLRSCSNVVVLFKNMAHDEIKIYYKYWGGLYPKLEHFKTEFWSVCDTAPYTAFVYLHSGNSSINTAYKSYRAPLAPAFNFNYVNPDITADLLDECVEEESDEEKI